MGSLSNTASLSLEEDDGQVFDQFKGKKSSYREDLYTTKLEENKITDQQRKFAEQKEKEILAEDSQGNVHLAEERQQRAQNDIDETNRYEESEEMKYSGVFRNANGQKPKFTKGGESKTAN